MSFFLALKSFFMGSRVAQYGAILSVILLAVWRVLTAAERKGEANVLRKIEKADREFANRIRSRVDTVGLRSGDVIDYRD